MQRLIPYVASFTDAWIETVNTSTGVLGFPSHLLQMRGLKLMSHLLLCPPLLSHLLQMRGLKLLVLISVKNVLCRIFYRCVD